MTQSMLLSSLSNLRLAESDGQLPSQMRCLQVSEQHTVDEQLS